MTQEAKKRNIGPEGREGGIILDEVAIQVYLYKKKQITLFKRQSI